MKYNINNLLPSSSFYGEPSYKALMVDSSPALETVRRLWYHKCKRNTFMDSLVARTQAGAAGIRNKGCPLGPPGALDLAEALTPDQGIPDSAG